MAMRDQMNLDAILEADAHFQREFSGDTDQLVSFGILPNTSPEGEEAKKEDPISQEIKEPSEETVGIPETPTLNTNDIQRQQIIQQINDYLLQQQQAIQQPEQQIEEEKAVEPTGEIQEEAKSAEKEPKNSSDDSVAKTDEQFLEFLRN